MQTENVKLKFSTHRRTNKRTHENGTHEKSRKEQKNLSSLLVFASGSTIGAVTKASSRVDALAIRLDTFSPSVAIHI